MILFWNTVVVLMFGLLADPGNVFVSLFNLSEVYPFFTRDVIVYYITIGSGGVWCDCVLAAILPPGWILG